MDEIKNETKSTDKPTSNPKPDGTEANVPRANVTEVKKGEEPKAEPVQTPEADAKIDDIKKSLASLEQPAPQQEVYVSHALPIKKLLATFVLFLIVIPGALLIFSKAQSKPTQSTKVLPTTAPQATPTPNPTDNWQTYKDTTLNYAMKYPAYWYTNERENKSLFGVTTKEFGFSPLASTSATEDSPVPNIVTITVKENSNSLALDELIDVFGCTGPNCSKKQQSKAITLSGQPAKMMDITDPIAGKQAIVLKNNKVYTITLLLDDSFAKEYSKADKEKIYEEMLATFTFLNKLPTLPTAGWKTYENAAGKYSIHYPADATTIEQNEENKPVPNAVKGYKNVTFAIPGNTPQSPTASVLITVSKLPTAMTIQDALDKGYVSFVTYKSKIVQLQNISIAGLAGYYTTTTSQNYVSDAFVEKGNVLYAFRLSAPGATSHDKEQLIFNTMLSSFDFTILPGINPLPNPLQN